MAARSYGNVSKAVMSPKHGMHDGAKGTLVGFDLNFRGLSCWGQSCVKAGRFGGEHEWLIEAPLDLCEALHDDIGIVLQGPPLGSLLDAEDPSNSDDLVVFWL